MKIVKEETLYTLQITKYEIQIIIDGINGCNEKLTDEEDKLVEQLINITR